MNRQDLSRAFRFAAPQAITASRIVLGGWALFAASFRHPDLAARMITLGAVTDGLDGPLARKLGVTSEFGSLFDYFADYLCYVLAPAVLSWAMLGNAPGTWTVVLTALPLLAGAIRYSRNAIWLRTQVFERVGFPGLGTITYAFLIVTLNYLHSARLFGAALSKVLLLVLVPAFSLMMVSSVRYPKIMKFKWIAIPVLVAITLMPFVFTAQLAALTLALGLVYTVASPFFIDQRPRI